MLGNVETPNYCPIEINNFYKINPVNLSSLTHDVDYKIFTPTQIYDYLNTYAITNGVYVNSTIAANPLRDSFRYSEKYYIAYSEEIINSNYSDNYGFPSQYAFNSYFYIRLNSSPAYPSSDYGMAECSDSAYWNIVVLKMLFPFCGLVQTELESNTTEGHTIVGLVTTTGNFIWFGLGSATFAYWSYYGLKNAKLC